MTTDLKSVQNVHIIEGKQTQCIVKYIHYRLQVKLYNFVSHFICQYIWKNSRPVLSSGPRRLISSGRPRLAKYI